MKKGIRRSDIQQAKEMISKAQELEEKGVPRQAQMQYGIVVGMITSNAKGLKEDGAESGQIRDLLAEALGRIDHLINPEGVEGEDLGGVTKELHKVKEEEREGVKENEQTQFSRKCRTCGRHGHKEKECHVACVTPTTE